MRRFSVMTPLFVVIFAAGWPQKHFRCRLLGRQRVSTRNTACLSGVSKILPEFNMQGRASGVEEFWLDARHLMNDLANQWGAAVVVAAPAASGFVVIGAADLLECERVASQREILDSRVCC